MTFNKTLSVVTLLLSVPFLAFCQNPNSTNENTFLLRGTISEQESNTPLPYINIGILNKPVGTVSDINGNYNLLIDKENWADTLQISSVGYFTKKVVVNDLIRTNDWHIQLVKKITLLQEVIVTNKKTKEETVGREKSGKLVQVSIHNKESVAETIGSEMGMKIKIKKEGSLLGDFNWYISANNFNNIKFRVNIYALKNNMPDTLLCNKDIFVTVENFKTGWSKFDLEPYNITVNDDFVITLQWIDSKMEKKENPVTMIPVKLSLFSKNTYARVASQDKWKRMGMNLSCFVTLLY